MANIDLDTLRQYKNVANQQQNDIYRRAAYYQYLAESDVTYGALAKGVVLDSTVSGIVANNFLTLRAQRDHGVSVQYGQSGTWTDISNGLMLRDYDARSAAGGADLDYRLIRDYHQEAFQTANQKLGLDCWTAWDPCSVLGQQDGSEQVWQGLVNGDLFDQGGVFLRMSTVYTDQQSPWLSLGSGVFLRAYSWCADVELATIKGTSAILGVGLNGISSHLHFGGLTDNGTIQLGSGDVGAAGLSATKLVSSDGGAFINLGGGAANVAETAGDDIIDMGTANEQGQAGDELVKLTQESPAQGTCVVFGKNCGHSVIQSKLDQTDLASYNSDTQTYKGLNNLHIVLDGLNKDDVELFYKTIYLDGNDGNGRSDPYRAVTVPGYIQIKSTGETLVLPDCGEDPNFHIHRDGTFDLARLDTQYVIYSTNSGTRYISDIDNKTYALTEDLPLVLPSSFSLTFADGSTVSGADAAKLFTSHEKAEHISYVPNCQGAGQSVVGITGPTRNAPDKYLAAEQNAGGAASSSQAASPGQDTLTGDGGADTLDPAGNAATVIGGGGNVAYVYKAGYGAVTVDNTSAANNGNMGTVRFGDGIAASDLTFGTAGEDNTDLLVSLAQGGSVTVADAFAPGGFGRVKDLAFADGSTLSFAAIKDQLTTGAPGSADLRGFASDDVLDSKGYATQAEGGGGDDTYVFSRGYGKLAIDNADPNRTGVEGTLRFGATVSPADVSASRSDGDLVLALSGGPDQVTVKGMFGSLASALSEVAFSDGTVWTRGALTLPYTTGTTGGDTLTGVLGGDTFDGKGGNDYEQGKAGGDTFLFGPGYGTLEVNETDYYSAAPNVLRFGAGITPDQVSVRGDASGNLVLTDATAGDRVTLDGMANWSFQGVQQAAFADGTAWDRARLLQMATIGVAGDDTLYGTSDNDVFDGKGGNDLEVGRGSAGDTYAYDPVLGSTYVSAGDIFVFNAGYGKLEIDERDPFYQPGNTLRLGAGITPDQVTTSGDQAGDLILTIGANGDQVIIDGQSIPTPPKHWWDFDSQPTRGVQAIAFADGTTWTGDQVMPKL